MYPTPLGPFWLHTRENTITALSPIPPDTPPDPELEKQVGEWLEHYFQGHFLPTETLPLNPVGTPFQRRVWAALKTIPPGRTESYKILADRLNTAPRPVGNALGANPVPILIPCHRVVGVRGSGGYSGPGGIGSKERLLELEQRFAPRA